MQERKGYSMNSYFMGLKQEEGGGHIMDKGFCCSWREELLYLFS